MPEAHTVDSPDAGSTLLTHIAMFDRMSRDRGAEYQRAGRVLDVTRFDDKTVLGEVRGSKLYTVQLLRRGKDWFNGCSCPVGVNCKHVVAVALQWLGQSRSVAPARAAVPPPAPRGTFRQLWEPLLALKLGRKLTAEEGALLGGLSQVFHNFRQSGRVYAHDLARLGFASAEAQRGHYQTAFEGWWLSPPREPMELWQYIAYDLEASGIAVPEFLRSVTDTAAIRAHLKDHTRREAVERWNQRFNQLADDAERAATSPREAEVDAGELELRLLVAASGWRLETRSKPDAPWSAAARSFLERLVRGDAALAHVEATPAVYAFLALCQQHARTHYSVDLQPRGSGASELLHRILSHRLARTIVVDGAGQPLVFADTPLVWQLARSAREKRDYELTLRLPDGSALPPGAPHLRGRPDLYLHGNTVYPGPPALDGVSATGAIVPAEAIERTATLRMLHRFGTKLPPEIAARFVAVPMRARIECELAAVAYSDAETFTLQLFAISDEPAVQETFTAAGWKKPPKSRDDERASEAKKIITFDLTAPNLAASRLEELKLTYSDYDGRWLRRFTKNFPEEFLAWREALPPEIEVLATGELASLLGAPVRAHVDFSLIESAAHRDWFDLALALKPEDTTLTPEEIALLLKARGKLVRLPGKGWRRLSVEIEGAPAAALEAAGFDRDSLAEAALSGERHRFHALQLTQSPIADLLPEQQGERLRARARAIALPAPAALPAGLRAELRPYQREGFHFLAFLSANQLGGVLADDMGLGKTVQTLAWLLWLAETGRGEQAGPLRALVVCPKSVVGNWEAEAARFAPALRVARFAPRNMETLPGAAEGGPLLVVANYTQLRLAGDFFRAQRWHAVVLDEGQFIKTPASKVAQIARELPGEHRIVLTGTPIENRLLDLWSLFSFALPGLLGSQAAFKRHYAQDNPLALTRLRSRVRHFLLRRTKAQVAADLPARTEEEVFVELEGEQRKLYEAELKRARAQMLKIETARQLDKARFNVLTSLLRLRQICCHPALVDRAHAAVPSAKLEELLERLEELRDEGHQVLVFSQFVEMLELIREKLAAAGIEHLMLTGQTEDRESLVRRFQAEKQCTVFLLSLKAAGFGLNLTAASYVILYDPWWNPAVEAQAIDRTHRIGQVAPVNAYRLIARNTVEEKIRALQREKSALAGAIVQEESLASVLDLESLRRILA